MSVGIATMGMFSGFSGGTTVIGGAPIYRIEEEKRKFFVLVKNVEVEEIGIISEDLLKNIKISFKDNYGGNT